MAEQDDDQHDSTEDAQVDHGDRRPDRETERVDKDERARKPDSERDTDDREGDDRESDADQLGDAGKRALDRMKAERKAARDEAAKLAAELQKYRDKDKSETERLQESAQTATSRAEKAETDYRSLQVAMDRAPEHATLAQVRAVAKRVTGESDDDLDTDADELFGLLAPKPAPPTTPKVSGRPAEKLRGGVNPEDEIEETDPRKLADAIRRR